jgi:hypothetical protein
MARRQLIARSVMRRGAVVYPHRWIFLLCATAFLWWSYDGWLNPDRELHRLADRLGSLVWAVPMTVAAIRWYRERGDTSVREPSETGADVSLPRWNWAAFVLCPIWSLGNGVYVGLLGAVPYLNLLVIPLVSIRGNSWAWSKNAWRDEAHFRSVQREWALWAISVYVAFLIAISLFGLSAPAA